MEEDDFGYGVINSEDTVATPDNKQNDDVTNLSEGSADVDKNNNPITDLSKVDSKDDTNDIINNADSTITENNNDYEKGTIIEYENNKYTIDENGNLVDKEGNIFKEAKDVKSWIESLNVEDKDDTENIYDIAKLQEEIGVSIVDDEDKPVEYENSPAGVKKYVSDVIENTKQDIINSTIDALYNKYPILEDVINYYVSNGNSLEGFNELKDRSKIILDVNNQAQCEAIIRETWKEENRKGNVDNYIEYLRAQDLLGATAEEELKTLVERDKAIKEELSKKAEEKEKQDIENQKVYWNNIYKTTVTDKQIGKYKLPDTIIINKDGKRTSATPKDFFNYIYLVDKQGHSQYDNDVAKQTPESRLTNALLTAYLSFTGGTYESLVNMAINESKVKTIKLKSKTSPKSKVKVTPRTNNTKSTDIDFGY